MAKKKKAQTPPQVLLFTDINIYPDDLGALVVLTYLHQKNLINLRGVVTELGDFSIRRRRALYAKGALCSMGAPFIRVVPGGDYEPVKEAHNTFCHTLFSDTFERLGTAILRSGNLFVQEFFKSVKDKDIIVLLNAPFPDFAHYMRMTEEVIKKKVKKFIAFGAALPRNESAFYEPDTSCFNFNNAPEAAQTLFRIAQEKNIKLILASKKNMTDIQKFTAFLDAVKESKNPVVQELLSLRPAEKESMIYDMFSALSVAGKLFLESGGVFEDEDKNSPVSFAKIQDANLLTQKFIDIFKEMFEVKKITLAQLNRSKEEKSKEEADDKPVA